jgi:hypothetical protein
LTSGLMFANIQSCRRLKSSMEFCRSRILWKKSLDNSGAGRILVGGASGGPESG